MSNPSFAVPPIATVMADLVACLCTELEETIGGPVCWCGLWHGEPVPWDYCDGCENSKCGMAYARVIGAFAYDSFPSPAIDQRCSKPLGYTVEVGVVRCFPVMGDDGMLPTPDPVNSAVLTTYDDMMAMRRALVCCAAGTGAEVWLDQYLPVNEGGCAGGTWSAFVNTER